MYWIFRACQLLGFCPLFQLIMRLVQSLGRAMALSLGFQTCLEFEGGKMSNKSKYTKLLITASAKLLSTTFVKWKGNL